MPSYCSFILDISSEEEMAERNAEARPSQESEGERYSSEFLPRTTCWLAVN